VRFAFCYWLLFCIPVVTTQVDSLAWSGKLIGPLWKAMVVWVGRHVLAISDPINTADNGSGDKAADWIFLLCIAALALIAALVWTGAESFRVRLERFNPDKMLLVSRGFHWINEVPFNR
jgi:hypothetical protein